MTGEFKGTVNVDIRDSSARIPGTGLGTRSPLRRRWRLELAGAVIGTVLSLALAACGGGGDSGESIVESTWQWEEFVGGDGGTVTPDNPANYTVLFTEDGSVGVQADCNLSSGTYVLEGNELAIMLGPTTLAECGPESLFDQYLSLFADVVSYAIEDGELFLSLAGDAGTMRFAESG